MDFDDADGQTESICDADPITTNENREYDLALTLPFPEFAVHRRELLTPNVDSVLSMQRSDRMSPRYHLPLILSGFLLLAALRTAAPSDLLKGDQQLQASYVMDILVNQHWIIQRTASGEIATKPPFYNWVAAGTCLLAGEPTERVIKFPSLLAGLGFVVLVYFIAGKLFGETAGFFAALTGMASHHFSKLFWFARTDMMVTFAVALAIYLLIVLRPGWTKTLMVGLVVGLSALVKGPVGPFFVTFFLVALSIHTASWCRPSAWLHVVCGGVLVAAIWGGWMSLTWNSVQFQQLVIQREMVDRVMGTSPDVRPFYYSIGHFFLEPFRGRFWPDWDYGYPFSRLKTIVRMAV